MKNLLEDGNQNAETEQSFQNDEMTPEISIIHNEFLTRAENNLPTFKASDEPVDKDTSQAQPYLIGQPVVSGHRKTKAINNQNVFQTALNGRNQLFFEGSSNDTVN